MKSTLPWVGGVLVAAWIAGGAGAQTPARPPSGAPPSSGGLSGGPAVATVGAYRITRGELDQNTERAFELYRERNQAEIAPLLRPIVRRQVLENLIRQRLLALEAQRRGVTVSDAEVEAQVRRDPTFLQNGVFNEAKYLAVKAADPQGFARAWERVRAALVSRRVSDSMDRETAPDVTPIRTELERELTHASIDYLGLRRADFDGTYPEPRESEVIAAYNANLERHRVPEEARVSVIVFSRPAPSDSTAATTAGYRAWEQRMRFRADSALSAIRGGARFEDIAALNGASARSIPVRKNRLPDFWRGSARDLAAVFSAAPGTMLGEPVLAAPGWAVVRVDEVIPSHVAPLREVARRLRADLRAAAKVRNDDRLLREVYAAAGDSLKGDGFKVRYAVVDTGSFQPAEPSMPELDRYYRAHLVDYTSYDRTAGTVVEVPLSQVLDDVRRRWASERRRELTRIAAESLREAWRRGRRDAALERSMVEVKEVGPIPAEGLVDSGRVGLGLSDALSNLTGRAGVNAVTIPGGYLVVHVLQVVPGYQPTLEQARVLLATRIARRRDAEIEAEARRVYEKDSTVFRTRAKIEFSRLLIERPPILSVELTREEVERYFRSHINEYSVGELVRIRHILVSPAKPGPEADAAARAKAEDILGRVRAGEDFAKLAAQYSDDPATRYSGGDVGTFRRGQMREGFERAAFAMRPGDITGPVHTDVGYHVMECLEYLPPIVHPLAQVYGNVAYACALRKSERIAADRADSLLRTLKSVAQARAVAKKLGLSVLLTEHDKGLTGRFDPILKPYILEVEKLKPGVLHTKTQLYEGLGQVITWVDTIIPPRQMPWEEAAGAAIDAYRHQSSQRVLLAKRAELDSMMAAGASFDTVAAAWGGLEHMTEAPAGTELRGMGGRAVIDSLVFGLTRPPVLEPGQVSEWIEFPGGFSRLRVVERLAPEAEVVARRVEARRQIALWRNLNSYFDRLKERYRVQILDSELRATVLPEPTET
ncbi:MAG TPA: peptidyl-prolyl cis-trans isomerase [Candidatus Eisenbacteria bacterium]|nr:peptidyl-prolyl cis-trans isomerase [Candidatus Eisenbacteria bacterium]